jgi:hypothetical protein
MKEKLHHYRAKGKLALSNLNHKFKTFKESHKIIFFLIVVLTTIFISRIVVLFYNPNPSFRGLELHHFDYGVFLLMITSFIVLFTKVRYDIYYILMGVAIGLIVDEYWFIRKLVPLFPDGNGMMLYESTIPSVVILIMIMGLTLFFIYSVSKRRERWLKV